MKNLICSEYIDRGFDSPHGPARSISEERSETISRVLARVQACFAGSGLPEENQPPVLQYFADRIADDLSRTSFPDIAVASYTPCMRALMAKLGVAQYMADFFHKKAEGERGDSAGTLEGKWEWLYYLSETVRKFCQNEPTYASPSLGVFFLNGGERVFSGQCIYAPSQDDALAYCKPLPREANREYLRRAGLEKIGSWDDLEKFYTAKLEDCLNTQVFSQSSSLHLPSMSSSVISDVLHNFMNLAAVKSLRNSNVPFPSKI